MPRDARRLVVKNELRQLYDSELMRLLVHLRDGREIALDNVKQDEIAVSYSPLAIAVGLPDIIRQPTTNKHISNMLELLGLRVYNTSGVDGTFFTNNRRDDLHEAVQEILWER